MSISSKASETIDREPESPLTKSKTQTLPQTPNTQTPNTQTPDTQAPIPVSHTHTELIEYKTLISKSTTYPSIKAAHIFPHWIVIYCFMVVMTVLYFVFVRYVLKVRRNLLRRISNIALFHNLSPIHIHRQSSDSRVNIDDDYLQPNYGLLNRDPDSYETVVFDSNFYSRSRMSLNSRL